MVHLAVAETLAHLGFAEQDPESPHRELPLTLPTLLVVPASPEDNKEPASLESPAEDDAIGTDGYQTDENQEEDEKSQFELGRAHGRIELLEQELQRREQEVAELRRSAPENGG